MEKSTQKLKRISKKSTQLGDKYAKEALSSYNAIAIREANKAYRNAISAIDLLLTIKFNN